MSTNPEGVQTKSSPKAAWILFIISTIAMVNFAVLYFFNPKTKTEVQVSTEVRTNVVTRTITNVVKETVVSIVTNEVVKEVPASIPLEYINAMQICKNIDKAKTSDRKQVLFGRKDVGVVFTVAEAVKEFVSEDELSAKFELTLRRNNIAISRSSTNLVFYIIEGFLNDDKVSLTYSVNCFVLDSVFYKRSPDWVTAEWSRMLVSIWESESYGYAGTKIAKTELLKIAESKAELFANDFLAANTSVK